MFGSEHRDQQCSSGHQGMPTSGGHSSVVDKGEQFLKTDSQTIPGDEIDKVSPGRERCFKDELTHGSSSCAQPSMNSCQNVWRPG